MRALTSSPSYESFRSNLTNFALSTARRDTGYKANNNDVLAYNVSKAAYGSQAHHEKLVKAGYVLDNDISTHNTRVYAGNGHALVGFRGTVADQEDYDADIAIGAGTHRGNSSFTTAGAVGKRAKDKYKSVHFAGHSLGGTKAVETARALESESTVFNPGTSALSPLDTSKSKVFRTNRDYISNHTTGSKPIVFDGDHSLSVFEKYFP